MKVVHIASGDLWAGAEVQLYNLVTTLHAARDVSVDVVLLNHGELETRLKKAGVHVTVLDESALNAGQILWRLTHYLRRRRPHLVHTHRQKENVIGSLAAALAGAPSLRSVHGRNEAQAPWWRLDKHVARGFDWACGRWLQQSVVAVSGQLGTELANRFGAERLDVIANGVDPDAIAAAAALQQPLPATGGRLKLAFIGRLVPVKRVDLFLQIARDLCDRKPGMIDFYIVGDGPDLAECRATIEAMGLRNNVHLLGFRADVLGVLAAMDMLLMTSDHEGLPMILLEAMSLGVPVVASAVGGIPAALDDGQCGRLVERQVAEDYVDAVLPLLEDPVGRAMLAQRASEHVRRRYSAQNSADLHAALYRRLCPGSAVAAVSRGAPEASSTESNGA